MVYISFVTKPPFASCISCMREKSEKTITITLSEELLEETEEKRGLISRSLFIETLILQSSINKGDEISGYS